MKKVFAFLFASTSLFNAPSALSQDKIGGFFCTRDLHPDIYDQIGKTIAASSVFTVTSSSIYLFSPLSKMCPKIAAAGIGGAGVAMLSYEYVYSLYKQGLFGAIQDSISDSMAPSSVSSVKQNFVKVQDKNLNNQDVSTYRHCSVLVSYYKETGYDGYIQLGKHRHTKGFFQSQEDQKEDHLGSSKDGASEDNDPLQLSTICTKVKDISDQSSYTEVKKLIDDFYMKAVDKGYNILTHNCCNVAYNAVKHIKGNTDAIDRSNFNHRIIPGLSFMVKIFEEDKEAENKKVDDL